MKEPEIVSLLVKRDERIAALEAENQHLRELLKEALQWVELTHDIRSVDTEMRIKTALK